MSSIYTDSFNQILNRVNSKSKLHSDIRHKKNESREEFAKLLSSVENKKDFQKSNEVELKQTKPQVLSNMTSSKDSIYNNIISYDPNTKNENEILGDVSINEPLILNNDLSVNNAIQSDKVLTQILDKPIIPQKERIRPPELKPLNQPEINNEKISFNTKEIKNIIRTAGRYHGVDPNLSLAIAQVESALKPNAVSKDGFNSKGIFQLLDSTADDMRTLSGMNETYQPFDPGMNSFLGIGYLRRLLDIFSRDSQITNSTKTIGAKSAEDLEKIAIAAYNAGEGSVARAQEYAKSLGKDPSKFSSIEPHLPAITRSYVKKVSSLRNKFDTESGEESLG